MTRLVRSRWPALTGPFTTSLLLVFAWMLLMRGILILHSGVWPEPGWMLLADAVGAVVLTLLLSITRATWLRMLLVLTLGSAFYIAGQHMWAHGTIFRLAHLGRTTDPVFLASSVVTVSLLLLPLYCLLAFVLHRLHRRVDPDRPPKPLGRLIAAMGCIVVYGVAVTSLTRPDNNVVVSTFAQVPDLPLILRKPPQPDQVEPIERSIENRFFHREVHGASTDTQPNVLVVVIEGMSGAYLPSVADYHDLTPAVSLPGLEHDLGRHGFRIYRNVLSMQRQTDRGSFPLLCGAYPRVGTMKPKLADVADGGASPVCIPDLLTSHGYQTGYLQAAPLEYMGKDNFMPRLGFEQVHGAEYFDPPNEARGWGPPDETFFPAAVDWLRRLDESDSPWFAVTLNAGTHHPFSDGAELQARQDSGAGSTPEESDKSPDPAATELQPERQAAFALMGRNLVDFLDALDADGMLDDTLVIITSDETGGFFRGEGQARMLDGNFGTLAVRPPAFMSVDRFAGGDQLVATLDIALTALDAAGLADRDREARRMIGRSLLVRQHALKRGLLVGDTYTGHTVFLLEAGDLLACGEGLIRCQSWTFSPERPFGTLSRVDAPPFLDLATRRRLADRAAIIEKPLE